MKMLNNYYLQLNFSKKSFKRGIYMHKHIYFHSVEYSVIKHTRNNIKLLYH